MPKSKNKVHKKHKAEIQKLAGKQDDREQSGEKTRRTMEPCVHTLRANWEL